MQELETALSDPYLWVFVLDMRDELSKTNLYDLQQVFVGLVCNFYEERGLVYGVAPPCRPGRAVDPPAPSRRLQPDATRPARADEGTMPLVVGERRLEASVKNERGTRIYNSFLTLISATPQRGFRRSRSGSG